MGKVLEFPHQAAWPPLPLRRPVPSVRLTYALDRDYPPGHPLYTATTVTVRDARILLDPALPQPAARRLYDLVARHHDRQPCDWIVLGQLTAELAARNLDWQQIGLDPARVCHALTRLCAAGHRQLIPEATGPLDVPARKLVAYHAGDPAMARYAAGWAAAQQAEDEAILAAWLQAHPDQAHPEAAADQGAGEDREGGGGWGWCPSWADADTGYADTWTDEDEALAVAEANALWEREQAQRAAHVAAAWPATHPARARGSLADVDPVAGRQPRRRRRAGSRWWFHAGWWLVIIAVTIGVYRLLT